MPSQEKEAEWKRREADGLAKQKECDRRERLAYIAARLGKRYSHERSSLAAFRVTYRQQQTVKAQIESIIEAGSFDGGILFYGSVGTGKDHLLAALLYAAAKAGKSADWINGQELYSRFRDAMDSETAEAKLMRAFVKPDVLGISDPIPPIIDPKKPMQWRTELLYRVIENRYRDCKPTWLTLNAQSPEDSEQKLSEPVFDRIKHAAVLIPCFWPSYRECAE